MATSITETVSINGWKNLRAQAVADGYTGSFVIRQGTIVNFNDTVAYLHLTKDGATNPSTASDGLPLSKDATVAPSSAYTLPPGTDIATVWINTGSALNIKYSLVGA